jgi:hypothetical protein
LINFRSASRWQAWTKRSLLWPLEGMITPNFIPILQTRIVQSFGTTTSMTTSNGVLSSETFWLMEFHYLTTQHMPRLTRLCPSYSFPSQCTLPMLNILKPTTALRWSAQSRLQALECVVQ